MSKPLILIIEDDPAIRHVLTMNLEPDYQILTAGTAQQGRQLFTQRRPDLLLLDLGLPDEDGLHLLAELRQWSDTPIIVVSARQREAEKVAALDAGADDYVSKPFGNQELKARIRRSFRLNTPEETAFAVAGFSIDFTRRQVIIEDAVVHFTPIEYEIVAFLARHAGQVLTHEQIMQEVWGPYEGDRQILRVNMANIRRKAESNPADPVYFLTEVGVGYRLADAEDFG